MLVPGCGVEARSVVLDDDTELPGPMVQQHADRLCIRMLQDVGQRLLHDAVGRRLDLGRQPGAPGARLHVHGDSVAFAPVRAVGQKCPVQAEVVERRRAQVGGRALNVTADFR